jgi:hypothetical protein
MRIFRVVLPASGAASHCEFSNNEVGQAWDDLTQWVVNGVQPTGDNVADPAAIATPDFGCAFTDRTAYPTGTRPLFAPCPAG